MSNLDINEALNILGPHLGSQRDLFAILLAFVYANAYDKSELQRSMLVLAVKKLEEETK